MFEPTSNEGATASLAPVKPQSEPVRLVIPAHEDYVLLVRSVAAYLGARLGLSVQDVDDFRLAVDEACCLFLTPGPTDRTLSCEFAVSADAVAVTLAAPVQEDFAGRQVGTFGWSLLESLVDGLWWSTARRGAEVRLLKRRPADDSLSFGV